MSKIKIKIRIFANQQGFIMVWSLLLLIVVTLLGAAGISTSIFEERMAVNEALHKQAFYEADGSSENGLALLVHNINCISGFASTTIPDGNILMGSDSLNFWLTNNEDDIDMPIDTGPGSPDYDFKYPSSAGTSSPRTLGKINGQTELMTGASLPMLAGYEGKGKAMGQDGAFLEYDIKTAHIGSRNSVSRIFIKFRLDNQFSSYPAGVCVY